MAINFSFARETGLGARVILLHASQLSRSRAEKIGDDLVGGMDTGLNEISEGEGFLAGIEGEVIESGLGAVGDLVGIERIEFSANDAAFSAVDWERIKEAVAMKLADDLLVDTELAQFFEVHGRHNSSQDFGIFRELG